MKTRGRVRKGSAGFSYHAQPKAGRLFYDNTDIGLMSRNE